MDDERWAIDDELRRLIDHEDGTIGEDEDAT
jgi:hypothetical protein